MPNNKAGTLKENFLRDLKQEVLSGPIVREVQVDPDDKEEKLVMSSLAHDILRISSCYEDIDAFLSTAEECGVGDCWVEAKNVFACQIYSLFKRMNAAEVHILDVVRLNPDHRFYVKLFREFDTGSDSKCFSVTVNYVNPDGEYVLNKSRILLKRVIRLDPPKVRYQISEEDSQFIESIYADVFYYASRIKRNLVNNAEDKKERVSNTGAVRDDDRKAKGSSSEKVRCMEYLASIMDNVLSERERKSSTETQDGKRTAAV